MRRCGINGDYTTAPGRETSPARRPRETSARAKAAFFPPTWILGQSRAFDADKTTRTFPLPASFRLYKAKPHDGGERWRRYAFAAVSASDGEAVGRRLSLGCQCGRVSARCQAATLGHRVKSPRPVLSVIHILLLSFVCYGCDSCQPPCMSSKPPCKSINSL